MLIEKYGKWKALYEDDNQCFSKAMDLETDNEVLIITHYSIESLAKSTRLLLPECLFHYLEHVEDEHGFHIVLKINEGVSLKKYLRTAKPSYSVRVQMCYNWLKAIHKYEQFADPVKIQLLDSEQLLVVNDQIVAREWIDYSSKIEVSWLDIFKQIGDTLDLILSDAKDYQSQWIENLITGNHSLFTFALLRKHFKSVFIYEKQDAINDISFEYNIVLNDCTSGHRIDSSVVSPKNNKPPTVTKDVEPNNVHLTQSVDTQDDITPVTFENKNITPANDVPLEIQTEKKLKEPTEILAPAPSTYELDSHSDLPNMLPRSTTGKRHIEMEEENDVETWFDATDSEEKEPRRLIPTPFKKWILIIIPVVIGLILGLYLLFGRTVPLEAKFEIEPLMENRVAFMNHSSGGDKIQGYLWEIYFQEQLVHSFTDEHLFPIFETEGIYNISLKLQDLSGTWTSAYTIEYDYKK